MPMILKIKIDCYTGLHLQGSLKTGMTSRTPYDPVEPEKENQRKKHYGTVNRMINHKKNNPELSADRLNCRMKN
jgi:hypothetical protein